MFNPYTIKKIFTIHEAAAAICGITRIHKDDYPELTNPMLDLKRAMEAGELPYHPEKIEEVTDWNRSTIARADLLAWLESQPCPRPELLFPDQSAEKPLHDDSLTYHTPALDALRAAISQFWLHHDPSRPPKSPEIVEWLIQEHRMSKTMAESIDRIIRPEELRKGGNTKLP